jgi:copper(I)-binding protein
MKSGFFFRTVAIAIMCNLCVTHVALAHEYLLKDLRIGHPYAIPTVAGQTTGAVYLSLENHGRVPVTLVRASTPMATAVELHNMAIDNNVARMRRVQTIEITPGETTKMTPGGGYHLMLVGLKSALKDGDKFPMTFDFAPLGSVEVSIFVQKSTDGQLTHQH